MPHRRRTGDAAIMLATQPVPERWEPVQDGRAVHGGYVKGPPVRDRDAAGANLDRGGRSDGPVTRWGVVTPTLNGSVSSANARIDWSRASVSRSITRPSTAGPPIDWI
jgi:hypothetical protein